MTNWAKVTLALRASSTVASKVPGFVGGQAEDERAEHVDAVLLEGLELLDEAVAGVVEVLEYGFEAFGGDGFDTDERSLDVGLAHGVEVLAVFGGLHGDLGEEDHVLRELGELGHEREALGAGGEEGIDAVLVSLLACRGGDR